MALHQRLEHFTGLTHGMIIVGQSQAFEMALHQRLDQLKGKQSRESAWGILRGVQTSLVHDVVKQLVSSAVTRI